MRGLKRPPIVGEPEYSHAHYWRHDTMQCGLATPAGACQWPQEPGMPWCNAHLSTFIEQMRNSGYTPAHAEAFFKRQGWDAIAVETVLARYERVLAPQKPSGAPEAPEVPAEPERAAEVNVELARRKSCSL
jgi:hypothetical protein